MAIKDYKVTDAEFTGKDVASLPDEPSEAGMSAAELKAGFDRALKQVVTPKHNSLIDALAEAVDGGSGADNIGATALKAGGAQTVQGVLEELQSGKADKESPTFSGTVIVPAIDGTHGDSEAANKKYVDDGDEKRIPKTDIVQLRGRSETQVMSQKAVTDAIDAGGGGGTGGGDFEPVGCMKFFAGETLPSGYLWCDGASYPANGDYAKLYGILGGRYNQPGDDVGTFRVPDLRGRVAVGKDAGTFDIVGKTGGEERQYISRDQLPNVNINVETSGSVSEPIKLGSESSTETLLGVNIHRKAGTAWANATVRLNGGQTQKPLSNLQPYLVCNYIIKYSKSYEEIGVTAPPCMWEFTAGEWQERGSGGYALSIPESEHRRGKYCVLTALYDTGEAGKLKAVLFEMEKDEAGNITIYSDAAFSGTAYIDRIYMVPAGRILTVNGQGPDMDGNVDITDVADAAKLGGKTESQLSVQNAAQLGGWNADAYMLKNDNVTLMPRGASNDANNIPDGARVCNVNAPGGGAFVQQMSYNNPIAHLTQIATRYNTEGGIYVRYKSDNTWYPWVEMAQKGGYAIGRKTSGGMFEAAPSGTMFSFWTPESTYDSTYIRWSEYKILALKSCVVNVSFSMGTQTASQFVHIGLAKNALHYSSNILAQTYNPTSTITNQTNSVSATVNLAAGETIIPYYTCGAAFTVYWAFLGACVFCQL